MNGLKKQKKNNILCIYIKYLYRLYNNRPFPSPYPIVLSTFQELCDYFFFLGANDLLF